MKKIENFADLPRYDNPPVIEVVCGVQFKPLTKFLVGHYGALWQRFKPEYSQCKEAAPLASRVERFDALPVSDEPPEFLPRTWFADKRQSRIVQVQRDRFLHNWRKTAGKYPHYEKIVGLFKDHYATFLAFIADNNLGKVEPLQYEMTYVNHVPKSAGWETLEEFGEVFPDFPWRSDDPWRRGKKRFLPKPDGRNLVLHFTFPDKSGRLYVTIRNGFRRKDRQPVLLLDLTVRGIEAENSAGTMERWFEVAHDWIVRGFADLCSREVQTNVWRRTR